MPSRASSPWWAYVPGQYAPDPRNEGCQPDAGTRGERREVSEDVQNGTFRFGRTRDLQRYRRQRNLGRHVLHERCEEVVRYGKTALSTPKNSGSQFSGRQYRDGQEQRGKRDEKQIETAPPASE